MAFLPAGFDEQLVLELIEQSVDRVLDGIRYAAERLTRIFDKLIDFRILGSQDHPPSQIPSERLQIPKS